jgi:hypothetical protein
MPATIETFKCMMCGHQYEEKVERPSVRRKGRAGRGQGAILSEVSLEQHPASEEEAEAERVEKL